MKRLWISIGLCAIVTVASANKFDQAYIKLQSGYSNLQQQYSSAAKLCKSASRLHLTSEVDRKGLAQVPSLLSSVSDSLDYASLSANSSRANLVKSFQNHNLAIRQDISGAKALLQATQPTCNKDEAQAGIKQFKRQMYDLGVLVKLNNHLLTSVAKDRHQIDHLATYYFNISSGPEKLNQLSYLLQVSRKQLVSLHQLASKLGEVNMDSTVYKLDKVYKGLSERYLTVQNVTQKDRGSFDRAKALYDHKIFPYNFKAKQLKQCFQGARLEYEALSQALAKLNAPVSQVLKKKSRLLLENQLTGGDAEFASSLAQFTKSEVVLSGLIKNIKSNLSAKAACLGLDFVDFPKETNVILMENLRQKVTFFNRSNNQFHLLSDHRQEILSGNQALFLRLKSRLSGVDSNVKILSNENLNFLKNKLNAASATKKQLFAYHAHLRRLKNNIENSAVYVCGINGEMGSNLDLNSHDYFTEISKVKSYDERQLSLFEDEFKRSKQIRHNFNKVVAQQLPGNASQQEYQSLLHQLGSKLKTYQLNLQAIYQNLVQSLVVANYTDYHFKQLVNQARHLEAVAKKAGVVKDLKFDSASLLKTAAENQKAYRALIGKQLASYASLKKILLDDLQQVSIARNLAPSISQARRGLLSDILRIEDKIQIISGDIDSLHQQSLEFDKKLKACASKLKANRRFFADLEQVNSDLQMCELQRAFSNFHALPDTPNKVVLAAQLNQEMRALKVFTRAKAYEAKGDLHHAAADYSLAHSQTQIPACRRKADLALMHLRQSLKLSTALVHAVYSYDLCDIAQASKEVKAASNAPKKFLKQLFYESKTQAFLRSAELNLNRQNKVAAKDDLLAAYSYTQNPACKTKINHLLLQIASVQ